MAQFSREQLQAAFDMVKSKADWKGPVDTLVHPESDLDLIEEGIMYFTGTVPSFKTVEDGRIRVQAVGYRMGPCGDC